MSARLSAVLAGAGIRPIAAPDADPAIAGVCLDSRRVRPGDVFCALPGLAHDGETFVPDAVERGAVAVLARSARPAALARDVAWVRIEHPRAAVGPIAREVHGRPDEALVIVGVTGTNGKTTVTWMLEAIAAAADRAAGRIGTTGIAWNGREDAATHTTPEAPDLFRTLAAMRADGVDVVAMEVSSHAIALERVTGVRFAVAAFLNLGRDHLDFHDDLETYFEAKAALFDRLDEAAIAVLPSDDPWGRRLAARTRGRVRTFGRSADADVAIVSESSGADGVRATLGTARGRIEIDLAMFGSFNVDNAAAAAACALELDIDPGAIERGLSEFAGVPGRTERVEGTAPFSVWVDYAHTEPALEGVLRAAREAATGRVVVVFGCGGERDRGKRAPMGACAATLAERVFVTSDNPRGEDPASILQEILEGIAGVPGGPERTTSLSDRGAAIRAAIGEARPGDVVVIAGKGHETGQTAGGTTVPFDDRSIAREALAHAADETQGGPSADA